MTLDVWLGDGSMMVAGGLGDPRARLWEGLFLSKDMGSVGREPGVQGGCLAAGSGDKGLRTREAVVWSQSWQT